MKKLNLVLVYLLTVNLVFSQKSEWQFDKAHTKLGFTVTHMMISEVYGLFNDFDGKVLASKDNFTDASIDLTIKVASINTDNQKRDEHLRSSDFFDVEKYPTISFKSKKIKKIDDKNFKLIGDLTIKGVTKEVTLNVNYKGTVKDPWGKTRAGFKLTGVINRTDFGLKWNAALETGGVVVSEEVNIVCDIELTKK